ncbi:MAG TPA: hypothetical protein VF006_28945 [Longimicrobium sp.]
MSKQGMTTSAAGRIQSAAAKAGGGQVKSGTFAARAQAAAARNGGARPAPSSSAKGGKKS